MTHYLLFVAGIDQPGIVAGVTRVLYDHRVNIHDSTMTRLGNTFGMILVLSSRETLPLSQLRKSLSKPVKQFGLRMDLHKLAPKETAAAKTNAKSAVLTLIGGDRTGIVFQVSELLAGQRVNILTVRTEIAEGGKGDLYMMVMELEIPFQVRLPALKKLLRELSKTLQVDITLRTVEAVQF